MQEFYNNNLQWLQKQIEQLKLEVQKKTEDEYQLKEELMKEKFRANELEEEIFRVKSAQKRDSGVLNENEENLLLIMENFEKMDEEIEKLRIENHQLTSDLIVEKDNYSRVKGALLESEEENYQFRLKINLLEVKECEIPDTQDREFKFKIYQAIYESIGYLPVGEAEVTLFYPENNQEVLALTEILKDFCLKCHQRMRNIEIGNKKISKQIGQCLIPLIKKYKIGLNEIME